MMRTRAVASLGRGVFVVGALAGLTLVAGCSSTPEFEKVDAATSGRDRADEWRGQGLHATAARQYEESARLAGDDGDAAFQARCLLDAAEAWLLDGRAGVAEVDVQKAERVIPSLPVDGSKRRALEFRLAAAKGDLALVGNRKNEARTHYEEAMTRALGTDRDLVAMRLSLLAESLGDTRRAKWYHNQIADRDNPRVVELRSMLLPASAAASAPTPVPAPAPTAAPTAPTSVALPNVLPRSAWGAHRMRTNLDRMTSITRITVHHTATRLPDNTPRTAADAILKFQVEHQNDKGWADIGYHFLIDPAGRIWQGRPLEWQGAHAGTPDLNVGNIGIALIGDFDVEQPSGAQKQALGDLLTSLCIRYHVDRGHVFTHKEIRPGPTECPGQSLQRVVNRWRASAALTP